MDILAGLDAEARAAHLALHDLVECPITVNDLRRLFQLHSGARPFTIKVAVTPSNVQRLRQLPGFVGILNYRSRDAETNELGAWENALFFEVSE